MFDTEPSEVVNRTVDLALARQKGRTQFNRIADESFGTRNLAEIAQKQLGDQEFSDDFSAYKRARNSFTKRNPGEAFPSFRDWLNPPKEEAEG